MYMNQRLCKSYLNKARDHFEYKNTNYILEKIVINNYKQICVQNIIQTL